MIDRASTPPRDTLTSPPGGGAFAGRGDDAVLWLGDCRILMPTLAEGSVDAIVTDPPFGIVNQFGSQTGQRGKRSLQFDWDTPETTKMVCEGLAIALSKLKRPGAAFVFCGFDQVGSMLPILREAGLTVKPAAWVKSCPPPAGDGNWWPSGFEVAAYGYHSGAWFGDTDPKRSNVFVGDSMRYGQPGKTEHPTQKPLWIMKRIVRSICPPGGIVLDPFMGSGTTGVACLKTGRRFIGIELNPKYVRIARRRLDEARTPLLDALEGQPA